MYKTNDIINALVFKLNDTGIATKQLPRNPVGIK